MPTTFKIESFKRIGNNLFPGQTLKVKSGMDKLPVSLHDLNKAHNIFASQEVFRNQVLKFNEGINLVSGEMNGEIFVLEASQAQELIKNALDAENLIAGLKP